MPCIPPFPNLTTIQSITTEKSCIHLSWSLSIESGSTVTSSDFWNVPSYLAEHLPPRPSCHYATIHTKTYTTPPLLRSRATFIESKGWLHHPLLSCYYEHKPFLLIRNRIHTNPKVSQSPWINLILNTLPPITHAFVSPFNIPSMLLYSPSNIAVTETSEIRVNQA